MKTFEIREITSSKKVAIINKVNNNFKINGKSAILTNNNLFNDMVKAMSKVDKEIWHDALPGNKWIFGGKNYIFKIEQNQLVIYKKEIKQVIVDVFEEMDWDEFQNSQLGRL